jgi:hypothetical protein
VSLRKPLELREAGRAYFWGRDALVPSAATRASRLQGKAVAAPERSDGVIEKTTPALLSEICREKTRAGEKHFL